MLTRIAKPLRSTHLYEWIESLDVFLARSVSRRLPWDRPSVAPVRTDLPQLDQCFDGMAADSALAMLAPYRQELAELPAALFLNGYFGPADVAFYWTYIRSRQPDLVIEIGSGYSSRVALRALSKNGHGRLTCIDPAPRLSLPAKNLQHISARMEEVDPARFAELRPRDILFIDSSHTSAEVQHHAAILERLPVGILVHYHDIDYPWERPAPNWDEDELVARFLETHPNWKVVVSGSYLTKNYLAELRAAIPHYEQTPYRHFNGLWLMRQS